VHHCIFCVDTHSQFVTLLKCGALNSGNVFVSENGAYANTHVTYVYLYMNINKIPKSCVSRGSPKLIPSTVL
jgi:hypothetical protein